MAERPTKSKSIISTVKRATGLKRRSTETKTITFGKFKLSFLPNDTLLVLLGRENEELTMLNSMDAEKLIEFLQEYIHSFE